MPAVWMSRFDVSLYGHEANTKSQFFLSQCNGSRRMTAGKRISTFKTHLILYSGVYGIMIPVKERSKESHHEFNICCVFVTLFFSPFFSSLPLKSSFMVSSQLENWSMRQKVTWSERTYICRACAHVWRSRRGSFLKRFDGDPLNADVVAIDSLYEKFCLFEFFLLRFPL